MKEQITDCPQWNNTNIYRDLDDPKIESDLLILSKKNEDLRKLVEPVDALLADISHLENSQIDEITPIISQIYIQAEEFHTILGTLSTFSRCLLSTNSQNGSAKKLRDRLTELYSKFNNNLAAFDIFISRIGEDQLGILLKNETIKQRDFLIHRERIMSDHLLSTTEESLISTFSKSGVQAWGKLYSDLAGSLKCSIDGQDTGYAQAASMLTEGNRTLREKAWRSIQQSWSVHECSAAAILNNINGWRSDDRTIRSNKKDLHYLDVSCHQSRITRKTLDTLLTTTYENRRIGQRALEGMAETLQLEKLGPWDLSAPTPCNESESTLLGFGEAMDIIAGAFSEFDPEMGEFARLMHKNGWIDARPSENRNPGAYCTKFYTTRNPRVFMTFNGTMTSVVILAHELGHAYHNWIMKDMPLSHIAYSMTLAETASIFAETLVRDYLYTHGQNESEKFEMCWEDAVSASRMLINIPARFEFEKRFVEARQSATLDPSELKTMMNESWKLWYENTLSEYDPMFWATKMHFSLSSISFYNYPYLFGYLFSLGIYDKKEKYGDDFRGLYKKILRDTGTMSAESLITKYFNEDIEAPSFWLGSLKTVEKSIDRFESMLKS
ncbi:MAG: M3 family oligoendopeptidase [Bacteriovoracaceae bacterium]|jgi:oligoendopeptidase F|nr:M3 family oligoendopeptidase [Bacteriovoracaceae bacterium]